ncbi:MAG: helix-turn-helix domain-containing protein [Hyphomicrobium sp.]|uniref:MerR family transcriptional regulator n=1 Tax=Hyphomicrobium sp. TaxID=82 RepID=UPI00132BD536|nr:helix-turn-helix domain-containing protein [Hyphomicrobium sp.]KAB2942294.1 MAG: helix-turn-helix domain-containing protein [Hyphomicrobium sp.]MBZ0209264.1 helix-turn-helix domain-containing protein [Hyphomicrobium sp.]
MTEVGIGKLSALTAVKIPTIRYYEQIGLLPQPARTEGGQRRYDAQAIRRLSLIRHARDLGIHIRDIRMLIKLFDSPNAPCHAAEDLARRQLAVVDAKLKKLRAIRAELEGMATSCPDRRAADCRILGLLSQSPVSSRRARGRLSST